MVKDSSGRVRSDTGGGATRRLFMQLPGVGARTAKTWFDLGYRCAVLCCAVLCHVVLSLPLPYWTTLEWAGMGICWACCAVACALLGLSSCIVLCCVPPSCIGPCCAVHDPSSCPMLRYAEHSLCCPVPCCAVLRCALSCAVLCCAGLYAAAL